MSSLLTAARAPKSWPTCARASPATISPPSGLRPSRQCATLPSTERRSCRKSRHDCSCYAGCTVSKTRGASPRIPCLLPKPHLKAHRTQYHQYLEVWPATLIPLFLRGEKYLESRSSQPCPLWNRIPGIWDPRTQGTTSRRHT